MPNDPAPPLSADELAAIRDRWWRTGTDKWVAHYSPNCAEPFSVMRRHSEGMSNVMLGYTKSVQVAVEFAAAAHQDVPRLLADLERYRAALQRWLDAEAGCDHPACNIGGGPCADCLSKVYDAKQAAGALLAAGAEKAPGEGTDG